MIWQLMHRIFGYDYIAWKNSAHQGIARVHVDHAGKVFYWRYKNIHVADRIEPLNVLWLTCKPEKYFPKPAAADE